nr:endonuclease or glycosyl hydrolase [Tanacetum cinerariifolium]
MKHLPSTTTILLTRRHILHSTRRHFSTSPHELTTSSSSSSYHTRRINNSSSTYLEDVRNVRVSVWWDFENCQVPNNANVFKVTQFITAAVRTVGIKGPISITAFGDVLQLSRANQEALSATGINLTHIPNGGKNSADRSLLVDLMYWVSQNPPPAHLMLISGDRDFASTLHRLRMNNYNILLASTENAPAVLCSAASIMWQWTSLVKGESLTGKHFNQPPDGPFASWYGHYRVPLEDPFVVCNQASFVQLEDASDSNSDIKARPIPQLLSDTIGNILTSYPKGISITELRSELGKKSLTIEQDFYGYKKFSRFLLAMPNLLKLQSQKDGQYIIHGISPKNGETRMPTPNKASGPSETTKDTKDSVPVVALKEDGATDTSLAPKKETLSSSTEFNEEKLSTDSQELHGQQEEPLQVSEQSKGGEVNAGQLYPIKTKTPEPEVGVFKSMWRKWFRGNDGHPTNIPNTDNECSTSQNSSDKVHADENNVRSKDQSFDVEKVSPSSLSTNEVTQDAEVGSKSAENDDKVSKPRGVFSKIVSWCKFWESDKNFDDVNAEISKSDKEISSHSETQEIFTETFWNDMLAYLVTTKGSALIFKSRTRQQMVQNLQKYGPSRLHSLSESHMVNLVELLLSEKKWVIESPSQPYPFRVVGTRSSSLSKNFNSKDSVNSNSEEQTRQLGSSMLPIKKKVSPKNRSQILRHCQQLVDEVVKEHPGGFDICRFKQIFLEKYGYPLEVQQLGYQKLATLLQIMPGVKLESNHIYSSGDKSTGLHTEKAKFSRKDDDSDNQWEELGPVAQLKTKKDDYETVSDDDLSDSEDDSSPSGSKNQAKCRREGDSSLLQILDSWYSNKEDSNNRIASDGSDSNNTTLPLYGEARPLPLYGEAGANDTVGTNFEQKQKPSKRYSFVAEKPDDDKENLINGILGSLKKSGNGSAESKIES